MAISFIAAASADSNLLASASAPVSTPVGTVNGDLMLACIATANESLTITAPAGWTQVPVAVNETTCEMRWYVHTAASEPGSRSWTFSGSTGWVAGIVTFRGASPGGVHGSSQANPGGGGMNHPTNPVTTLSVGAWLATSFSAQNVLPLGWTPPPGMTERWDRSAGLLGPQNVVSSVDSEGPVAVGTYTRTATATPALNSINSLLAVEPDQTVTGIPLDRKVVVIPAVMGPVGILGIPLDLKAPIIPAIVGPVGILAAPVDFFQTIVEAAIIPGEVFLEPDPLDFFQTIVEAVITPGEVVLGGLALLLVDSIVEPEITPGEVTLLADPLDLVDSEPDDAMMVLGQLLSSIVPLDTQFVVNPDVLMGLRIGPGPFVLRFFADSNTLITALTFAQPTIYMTGRAYGGVCCPA